jgi:hypothetical protein
MATLTPEERRTKAARMRRYRARMRRERTFVDGCRWFKPSEIAKQFNKSPMTIRRWCGSGFILTLGYRLRRDVKGQTMIGVPLPSTKSPQP